MLDLFYDELDEITSAAARRHTDHCTRCRDLSSKLRATREVGALPLVDPPEGLVESILLAEQRVRAELPARQRFGRAISVLAGYAMRPQLAMAALLLLVIGSSLLLLRGRPGEQKNVLVTERGVPESESDSIQAVPLREPSDSKPAAAPRAEKAEKKESRAAEARAPAAAPVPAAAAPSVGNEDAESQAAARASEADRGYEEALTAYRDRRYDEAQRRFDDVASRGGENAASAALYAAQSARARSGCPSAAVLFEQVRERYPDSPSGQEASWQAAGCYRTLGDFDRARHNYETLLSAPGFADRAQAALASLGDAEPSQIAAERVATAKRARPAAAAAPARPPAAAPPKGTAANAADPAKQSPRTSDTK
jgi:TolA-binding protein